MSQLTDPALEDKMIYSVFVRNYSPEGTLEKVTEDLDRIRSLSTDILWLMPIYPVGTKERKGKDGSPYAITDYRKIDPMMGTWDDLTHLVDEAHKREMKVIVDIVFNHTSPDSRLLKDHPEWFYHDENGNPHSLHKEWSDIVDLDYSHEGLQDELIDTLKQYAAVVDGFRCDVASRVPVSFWKKAREACHEVNPDLFWLAESCHLPFVKFCRDNGRIGESDSALCEAFDVLYDYDALPYLEKVFREGKPMSEWIDALIRQDAAIPAGAIKLRYLENHDTDRIAEYVRDWPAWKNWMAMLFTLRGLPMLYHGQECRDPHRPSIFDQDVVEIREDREAADWIRHLHQIHTDRFSCGSPVDYHADEEHVLFEIDRDGYRAFFLLKTPEEKRVPVDLADGDYRNLFDEKQVSVQGGCVLKESFPLLIQEAG